MQPGDEKIATLLKLDEGLDGSEPPIKQIGQAAFRPINQRGKVGIIIVNLRIQIHHVRHPGCLIQPEGAFELPFVGPLILGLAPGHQFQGQLEMRTVQDFKRSKLPGDLGA